MKETYLGKNKTDWSCIIGIISIRSIALQYSRHSHGNDFSQKKRLR